MRIGELAKISDLPASTIRFYEQKGLMPKAQRSASGYRLYDETALDRLQLIKFAQSLGFSLDELPTMFNDEHGLDHNQVMQRLEQKYREVDILLRQLMMKKQQMGELIRELKSAWGKGVCMDKRQLAQILSNTDI